MEIFDAIAFRFRIGRKCFDNLCSDEVSCSIKFLKKPYLTMIARNDFGLDDTSGSTRSGLTLPLGIILYIITGRNEVVAKVMFLHVSVILLTGGGLRGTPPDQTDPPGPRKTPRTKENPPWDQGEPPPPRKNTAAYGQ